ncbi:MAG: rhomboid family intramembrane serine protease [Bacteroidetes bacterium]|nr:rhomboid family intramembrane serine protease [Bacteroidota bacterium]
MPRFNLTPVVLNLLIINVLVFIAFNIFQEPLAEWLILWKSDLIIDRGYYGMQLFKPVQLVTAFFSHLELFHIAFNMLALVSFGPPLEMVLGPKRFLASYLTIGVGSSVLLAFLDPSIAPVLGASGAIAGMLVLFAAYFPQTQLGLMFLPFRFPVRKFVIGAAVLSAALVIIGATTGSSMGGISHFGHLAGMVVGFIYLQFDKVRKIGKR